MLTPPSNPKCPSCGTYLPLTIGREQLDALFELLQDIRARLDEGAGRAPRRDAPDQRVAQLADLESEFRYMEPGARSKLIMGRLGLSKTTYYRLRNEVLASPTSPTDSGTEW